MNGSPERSIRMGEMAIGSQGEELRTLLGSCIGVAIYSSRAKVGGLVHIVLPQSRGNVENPFRFADTGVPALRDAILETAGRQLNLVAKIAGGAAMFGDKNQQTIGGRNEEACRIALRALRIPIMADHCGGEQGRRMLLETATGRVIIEQVGLATIEI